MATTTDSRPACLGDWFLRSLLRGMKLLKYTVGVLRLFLQMRHRLPNPFPQLGSK